jgi:PAS domain S-box-containing protein
MNFGYLFDVGAAGGAIEMAADILTAISFLSIFLALTLVVAKREAVKYRRTLFILAFFVLLAGLGRILSLTSFSRLQAGWNLISAALSVVTAIIVVFNLPRYLRMPKIAEELRGQAGFLEEQQALLQAIQDSVSEGILLLGESGEIRAFNAAALRILWGGESQQPKLLPEAKDRAIRALAQGSVQGSSGQDVIRWENRLIERFHTEIPSYGKLYVFRDITMRRQLEEQRLRLERVITSMKEGFAIVAFDNMRILSTNPAMEQMLGYEKNELAGRKFSEIHAGDENERQATVETLSAAVLRDGFWEGELRNRRKDGSELFAHTTVSLVREGESQYFSYIQVDITDQKRLRDEKERLQGKLMETQRLESLARMAEGVGHEFNNLLTGIMGNTGLVLDALRTRDPIAMMLEDVMRASERAAVVSRQLLAFSGKAGRVVVHPLDLSELVEELGGLAQASISKKVQFRLELGEGLPMVEADTMQLRQVALNLIANGAEAIGEASGTVLVSTGLTELDAAAAHAALGSDTVAPGSYVYFEVRDDGAGMDEETRSHIFDPFFTTKAAGRGLGLAAVLGIVRAHHGAIQVSSAPGKGSSFRVLLPAAGARVPLVPALAAPEPSGGRATILVVEDEPIVRRTTLAALAQYGFDVRAAENGAIAVEMFEQMADQISIVLLDVVMPVMGGEEALGHIKRIRPDVPVLICSGHNEVETVERFNDADVDGIVKKPYTARRLVEQLRAVLERRYGAVKQSAGPGR